MATSYIFFEGHRMEIYSRIKDGELWFLVNPFMNILGFWYDYYEYVLRDGVDEENWHGYLSRQSPCGLERLFPRDEYFVNFEGVLQLIEVGVKERNFHREKSLKKWFEMEVERTLFDERDIEDRAKEEEKRKQREKCLAAREGKKREKRLGAREEDSDDGGCCLHTVLVALPFAVCMGTIATIASCL